MAKFLEDPPGFERTARQGTPQSHADRGHDLRVEGDGE